jgi:hypothetical protein
MLRITAVIALGLVATASAFAAASARAGGGSQVLDKTYTCRVRPQHYIDVNTSVSLPPVTSGYPTPAQLWLDTVHKTKPIGNLLAVVPQVAFEARKNTLQIDKALCRRSSHRVPLKPAGVPLYETVTPEHGGHINARCGSTKRVLVRFRIKLTAGKPQQALFAVRNDAVKARPLEFVKWSSTKITGYLGNSCTDTG